MVSGANATTMHRPGADDWPRQLLPSSLHLLVLLWMTNFTFVSGAYVQAVACDDVVPPYRIGGLDARVDNLRTQAETPLYFDIFGLYQSSNLSNSVLLEGNVTVTVTLLSLSSEKSADLPLPEPFTPKKSSLQKYRLPLTVNLHPFDDYLVEIRLRYAGNSTTIACSRTAVTPMLQRSLASTAQWLSPATLALVLLALLLSCIRVGHQSFANDSLSAISGRVADCVSYIQFFFFLGALTLHFPGFIRPITSSSSWSTLMFPGGPIMGDSLYLGVSDGIYQVNGTFGGTAGLELISQITGAPATTWNWINIISLACMLLASLMLIFQLGPKVPWTSRVFDSKTMQRIRGTESHGVRGTLYTVLRLFFSYFMTPVAAWTSYQLTLGSLLPVYHIVICSLVLTLIPVAFWWSLRQATARQLGYFLVDARFKREDAASVPRAQDQFAFVIFVLMYLRGCAIGGLQMSGFFQLLALGACEIVQLVVAVFLRRAIFMDTGVGLLCALRLVFLLLCVGFLPGVTGHVQRSVLGVVVLSIHMVILAAVFIGPSTLRIALLGARMMRGKTQEKQVFRLSSLPPAEAPPSGSSHVQHWIETVSPADRVSIISFDDALSTCDNLVDRPQTTEQMDAISHNGGGQPSSPRVPVHGQTPNFSRPLSMPLGTDVLVVDAAPRGRPQT